MKEDTPPEVAALFSLLAQECHREYMRRYMQRRRARQRQLGTYHPPPYDPKHAAYMREWRARQRHLPLIYFPFSQGYRRDTSATPGDAGDTPLLRP